MKEIDSLKERLKLISVQKKSLEEEKFLRNEIIMNWKYKWELSRIELMEIREKLSKAFHFKEEYQKLLQEKDSFDDHSKELSTEIVKLENENESLKYANIELKDLVDKMEKEISFLNKQLTGYDDDMFHYEQKIDNLKKCREDQFKKYQLKEAECLDMNKTVESMKIDLEQSQKQSKALRRELSEIETVRESLKCEIEHKNSQIEELREALKVQQDHESSSNKMKDDISVLIGTSFDLPESHFVSLHEEISKLQKKLFEMESENKSIKEDRDRWKNIADELKEEILNVHDRIGKVTEDGTKKRVPTPMTNGAVSRLHKNETPKKNTKLSDIVIQLISENKQLKGKIKSQEPHKKGPTPKNYLKKGTSHLCSRLMSPKTTVLKDKN